MLKPIFDFDYLGLPIYNLMAIVGGLVATMVILERENNLELKDSLKNKLNSSSIVALGFGVFTANIANWFLFPEVMTLPLLERFATAGFTFYFGMLGFFVSFVFLLKMLKINWRFWLNEIVPSVLIFHAFGRIGCSLSGCCYGVEIEPILALRLHILNTHLFPAREIEALCLFVFFFLFKFKLIRNRLPIYLGAYAVLRFLLEFGRNDNRGILLTNVFSPSQIVAIVSFFCIVVWFINHVKHS